MKSVLGLYIGNWNAKIRLIPRTPASPAEGAKTLLSITKYLTHKKTMVNPLSYSSLLQQVAYEAAVFLNDVAVKSVVNDAEQNSNDSSFVTAIDIHHNDIISEYDMTYIENKIDASVQTIRDSLVAMKITVMNTGNVPTSGSITGATALTPESSSSSSQSSVQDQYHQQYHQYNHIIRSLLIRATERLTSDSSSLKHAKLNMKAIALDRQSMLENKICLSENYNI
jgi:hypothetical protein